MENGPRVGDVCIPERPVIMATGKAGVSASEATIPQSSLGLLADITT